MLQTETTDANEPEVAASDDRLAVTIPEAVRISGFSRSRLYEYHKKGKLPFVKDGTKTTIRVARLRDLLIELEVA